MQRKGFQCPTKKFQCKVYHKFGHFTTVCYQKIQQTSNSLKPRKPKAHQLKVGALYTHQDGDSNISEESSMDESFCLQMKVQNTQFKHQQLPTPAYLMTNLVYCLKMYHRQNQYLCARLDTCADINLMPVAVYQLMFKDPGFKEATLDNRFMPILPIASRNEEIVKGHFLHHQRKLECTIIMQDDNDTWIDQTLCMT